MNTFFSTINTGFVAMKNHSQLLFVGVLLFVFPIWFVSLTQNIFTAAESNTTTSQKLRVGTLHDSVGAIISTNSLSGSALTALLQTVSASNDDIESFVIAKKVAGEFIVEQSLDTEQVGRPVENPTLYQSAIGGDDTFIFEDTSAGYRVWHAVRIVENSFGEVRYVYTEHNLRSVDTLLAARQQQSYFALSGIFLFLIALAYWISRQISWQARCAALEQELKERDLFSSMITHEFRTPLTAIQGYGSFLREAKGLTDEEKRYVSTIETSTERLLALVNDFLEVARIQSGKMEITRNPVNINELINSVVTGVEPMAKVKNLQLLFSPSLQPITLATDVKRFSQVIQNLLTNAIKYTETGRVEVTTETTPTKIIIRIKDTGMGIAAEDQGKLFAPFSRVGGVEKTNTVGTGLGMWITRQLVTLLGGTIGVESIKGVGTHVVLSFKNR